MIIVTIAPVLHGLVVRPGLGKHLLGREWSVEDGRALHVCENVVGPAGSRIERTRARHRGVALVVGRVHLDGEAELVEVARVHGALGGQLGLGEYWEEDCGEDRDDRDHDEEFDEGKGATTHV